MSPDSATQAVIRRALSGMRPTGSGGLHLGHYFGAIPQFLDLQNSGYLPFYFAADLHALTEIDRRLDIDNLSIGVVKNYVACGIDPTLATLYRQSDIPEIPHIAWLLGNTVTLANLRRCTTYRGKVDSASAKRQAELGRPLSSEEADVVANSFSYGLMGYPILMAADILCVKADRVPVGEDQVQHVEFARDFARQFNSMFDRDVFHIPEVNIPNPIRVPGIDGAGKMGKSTGNSVDLLDTAEVIHRKVMGITTQSNIGGDMLPGTRALFTLVQLCCPPEVHAQFVQRFNSGDGKFFSEMKRRLAEDIIAITDPIKRRFREISDDDIRDVLNDGARQVRPIAAAVLEEMQVAMGLRR